MAISLIEQYSEKFNLGKYEDIYNEQLMKIIDAKSTGKAPKPEKFESKPTPAKDLMAQLKASLEKKKKNQAS